MSEFEFLGLDTEDMFYSVGMLVCFFLFYWQKLRQPWHRKLLGDEGAAGEITLEQFLIDALTFFLLILGVLIHPHHPIQP